MNYSIKIYGCKLNQAETEGIEKLLSKNFKKTSSKEADIVVLNSCGVIDKTERKVLKKAKKWKNKGKRVVITGCLPSMTEKVEEVADVIIKGNDPDELRSELSKLYDLKKEIEGNIPVLRREGSASAIIPVATGCMGSCSYCSAKIARGSLNSFSVNNVVEKAQKILRDGVKELQITSQDLSVYGRDINSNLKELLANLLKIKGNFKLKLGMMNPGFIEDFEELLDFFKDDKLYKFIHLPVQSGSNKILDKMNRKHTSDDFVEMMELIKETDGRFLISTDIIVGFPGETEEQFKETIDLIKKTKPHIINITRYSEREGTVAANLKDMPSKIKKRRSRKLTDLAKRIRIEDNKEMVGKTFEALIFREGKNNTKLARIFNGKAVVLKRGEVGSFEKVKITDFKHNYLIGDVQS